jgi:hypothetical protein
VDSPEKVLTWELGSISFSLAATSGSKTDMDAVLSARIVITGWEDLTTWVATAYGLAAAARIKQKMTSRLAARGLFLALVKM